MSLWKTFRTRNSKISRIGVYAAFILFVFVVLIPVFWIVRSSVSTSTDLRKLPLVYFPQPTMRNFETLAAQVPLAKYFQNTIAFAVYTKLLTLVVSFPAAYAFARIRFPGSGVILWTLVLSMALPEVGTIVPLYKVLRDLNLLDSIGGITLVMGSALVPFTVWVLISFIKQVPYEIEEAAIMDGASLPQIYWHILLPLVRPGLVTMGLINFINAWNNLLFPLSFTTSPSSKTLSVAVTEVFAGYSPYGKPWELIMTVGVVMVVPVMILVLLSERAIVRGLTGGGIK